MSRSENDRFQLEELADQPGFYFNPQTEVAIIVDDSVAMDPEGVPEVDEESPWVRISEEAPIDEQRRDELLEELRGRHEDTPGDEDFEELDEIEPDEEGESEEE